MRIFVIFFISALFLATSVYAGEQIALSKDFKEVARAEGDLNKDGTKDIALITQKIMPKDSQNEDFPPQEILVFLGDNSGNFNLWKRGEKHFLNSHPNFMDPNGLLDFKIEKGVLVITSSTALTIGGWSSGGCTQKWRNEEDSFRLIGLKVVDIDRKCACGTSKDTNYLTGASITKTDADSEGNQMEIEEVTKTKSKPQKIFWESFNYDKFCSN